MAVSYTVSNHKLKSPSQISGALSDTRIFGLLCLENMILRICFIVELILSSTRITSGQPEKEVNSILWGKGRRVVTLNCENKSP